MLGRRLFCRLALPVRSTPLAFRTRPALSPHTHLAVSLYSSDSPEDAEGSTSKEPIPAYATVPYVTSRLDKQDHQIEVLGRKMEEGFRDLNKSIHDLNKSIHEAESKFHATLSQWLFRAATLTVGVALVSASAFLFPPLKQLLETWDMEKKATIMEHQARAREHEARAEREQVELKIVKSEIV